jgi:hypothetical protein
MRIVSALRGWSRRSLAITFPNSISSVPSHVLDSILRNVKQDDSNNEVDSTPTMKSLRQAAASNSTIFWIALSAR